MKKRVCLILLVFLYFFAALTFCTVLWALNTWVGLTMDELVYHLMSPLKGTGGGMIGAFVLKCFLPAVVTAVLAGVLLFRRNRCEGCCRKSGKTPGSRMVRAAVVLAPLIILAASVLYFGRKVNFVAYIKGQVETSSFVQEHYVDPDKVELTFPKQKRNLIYIYLESMETTYGDTAVGGAFEENVIPELTEIALDNQCFGGKSGQLNGGIALPGTTWTMGALMGQTSGLPLQLYVKHNAMSTQEHFFDNMTALGDLLEEEDYRQIFLLGSKASFGGRDTYFKEHGNYELMDYRYAVKHGWIPEDYFEFWGYEDEKLFSHAKEELLKMAAERENTGTPFSLTILTVDTHFEDGYCCRLCRDDFSEQYANVLACSSRQTAEFVSWVQQQDFYKDTTIVLSGDHLTMDSDFCGAVDSDYMRRTYTAILNGTPDTKETKKAKEKERLYSTFDLFPTTLAAMGVDIEGDRLGLGVNLYSEEPTLLEQYGIDEVTKELEHKSLFIEELADIDMEAVEEAGLTEDVIWMRVALSDYDVSDGSGKLMLSKIHGVTENTVGFQVWLYPKRGEDACSKYSLSFDREAGGYVTELPLRDFDFDEGQIRCFAVGGSGKLWETTDIAPMLMVEKSLYDYDAGVITELPEFSADKEIIRCLPSDVKKRLKALGYE